VKQAKIDIEERSHLPKLWLIAAAAVVFVLWLAWVFQTLIFREFGIIWRVDSAGQLGDTFGALNALFSAFGILAILATLSLQARDLREQQKQISQAQTEQGRQRFERTFFELFHLLREERAALSFSYSHEYRTVNSVESFTRKGTQALRAASREAAYWIREKRRLSASLSQEEIASIYRAKVHDRYESSLGPYFRTVYAILRRIKDAEVLTLDEKLNYSRLLRSQLTSHEAALAGINGLAPFAKDFSLLVAEFRMLKYVREGELKNTLRQFYPDDTFKGRRPSSSPTACTSDQFDTLDDE
jgi:hypothetical protein